MPLLLLSIALLVGLYGLYRFLLQADVKQVMALFLAVAALAVAAAMFFLALTGRLAAALALLVALWPMGAGMWMRHKRVLTADAKPATAASGPMDRARDVLLDD